MSFKDFIKRILTGAPAPTVKREIIVNAEALETRVAVLEDGRLEDFQVEHPSEERLVGSIFKGRIQNLENDLQAAFVDIGLRKNAFLHYWDMNPDDESRLDDEDEGPAASGNRNRKPRAKRFTTEEIATRFPPGAVVTVQVSKGPISTKGPRVTASLSIPGRYLGLMPGCTLRGVSCKIGDADERKRLKSVIDRLPLPPDCGVIVRTAGSGASKRSFVRDLRVLRAAYDDLKKAEAEKAAPCCIYEEPDLVMRVVRDWMSEDIDRIVVDNAEVYERLRAEASKISRKARNIIQLYEGDAPIMDRYGVEKQFRDTFRRRVYMKSGAYLVIDETEALIAIDVNTGRHKSKGNQEDSILEVNLEAVEEVARQLRLRNIGGLVVIDLIDMKSRKNQQTVLRAMRTAIKRDKARTNILPISDLGLMEMTRQRLEESLLSQMHQFCPCCRGFGKVRSPLQLSIDIQRQLRALCRRFRTEKNEIDLVVQLHPAVLNRIRTEDEELITAIQKEYAGKLSFKSDPLRQFDSFSISDTSGKALYSVGEA